MANAQYFLQKSLIFIVLSAGERKKTATVQHFLQKVLILLDVSSINHCFA